MFGLPPVNAAEKAFLIASMDRWLVSTRLENWSADRRASRKLSTLMNWNVSGDMQLDWKPAWRRH